MLFQKRISHFFYNLILSQIVLNHELQNDPIMYYINMNDKQHIGIEFFKPTDVGPRNWGREILIAHVPGLYTGKLLIYNKGAKGGVQKHHLKNECGYVYSGKMLVRYDEGDGKLKEKILMPGDALHIPPGAVHQEEALEETVVFETSTPHFNDRVRMESEYGQEIPEGGLPSTTIDQVETR